MRPANPAEEQTIRELATFRARLLRLQSIEYVLLCSEIEPSVSTTTAEPNEFKLTAAFLNNEAQLTRLSKAEAHLQRAYNRTWNRLLQLQKDRHKLETPQNSKRTQPSANECQQTPATNNAQQKAAAQTGPASHQGMNQFGAIEKLNQNSAMTTSPHRLAA